MIATLPSVPRRSLTARFTQRLRARLGRGTEPAATAMNVAHLYEPLVAGHGAINAFIEFGAGPPRLVLQVSRGGRTIACRLDADGVARLARIADDAKLRLDDLARKEA